VISENELQRERVESRASILAVAAWSLSTCALFNLPGPDAVFRLTPVIVGTLTTLPALLLLLLEPERRQAADRSLLLLGAVVLASLGISYVGSAEPWRVAFAYLVPSAFMMTASLLLALPSASRRIEIALRDISTSAGT
jgi:peptidoglycan/LPS O-acetylase OafA/YrhL